MWQVMHYFFFKDMYLIMNGMNLGKKVKAKTSQI